MKRFKHNLSHWKLVTGNMGEIMPISCYEVIPQDHIQQRSSVLMRLSPLENPTMHPVDIFVKSYFVASRTLWTSFEDFITGGDDGNNADTVPTVSTGTVSANRRLLRMLGVPDEDSINVNALPLRAFNKVINTYFRDPDLTSEFTEDDQTMKFCHWQKDRYT